MPTKSPRINVVLDETLYAIVQSLAQKEGVSLSLTARDLIKEALESYEDLALSEFAEERDRTYSRKKSLTHHQVWEK